MLDPIFQHALKVASVELFRELEKHDFQYDSLNEKLRIATFKYYNRMSYRTTPFGAFASVSTSSWTKQTQNL